MNKIIEIDNTKEQVFQITWDVGRRCNYDCTYCPANRHNNWSAHSSYEDFTKTLDYCMEYFELIKTYMKTQQKLNISFTGGEPTNNPNFLNVLSYYIEQSNKKNIQASASVTSNGTFSENYANELRFLTSSITISYHCEADQKIKKKVIDRIYQLHNKHTVSVNLMFHAKPEYFEECVKLAGQFTRDGISFIPRIIGENYIDTPYSHRYTEDQHRWFTDYWSNKSNSKSNDAEYEYTEDKNKTYGRKTLGRPCCGGREFCSKSTAGNSELTSFLPNTEFKNWVCMVNWHWLHIEQEHDKVYHHQTCQATFNNSTGPIGTISRFDIIIEKLKKQFDSGVMPMIVCSRDICGCGLCLSKAKSPDDAKKLFGNTVKYLKPEIGKSLY